MDIIRKDKYNIMYNHYNDYITGDFSCASGDEDGDIAKTEENGNSSSERGHSLSGGQNSLFNHMGSIPKCPANSKELHELYNMEDQLYNMKKRVR